MGCSESPYTQNLNFWPLSLVIHLLYRIAVQCDFTYSHYIRSPHKFCLPITGLRTSFQCISMYLLNFYEIYRLLSGPDTENYLRKGTTTGVKSGCPGGLQRIWVPPQTILKIGSTETLFPTSEETVWTNLGQIIFSLIFDALDY